MTLHKSKASGLHSSITRAVAADNLKKITIASIKLSVISIKIISTLKSIISESLNKNSEKSSDTDNTEHYKELLENLQRHCKHAELKIKITKKQFLLTIILNHTSSLTFILNMLITTRHKISVFFHKDTDSSDSSQSESKIAMSRM